jgi:putative membrane protein
VPHETVPAARASHPADRIALGAFWLFTIASVAGYATFGRHPELLARVPNAMDTYAIAFTFFPRAHVLLAFGVLVLLLVRLAGLRWLPAFAAVYAISLASELLGTTIGLPFGAYAYTDGLGPKWFGHVPLLIPLSWFFMALPSWLLARRALPVAMRRGPRGAALGILGGSLVLLAWDLALDPAMSWVTKYWVWGSEGPYYGMPFLNLFGWYVTGLAIMAAFAALRADQWAERLPSRWLLAFWLANFALPLGMMAAAGLAWGVAVSVAGALLAFAWPRLLPAGAGDAGAVRAPRSPAARAPSEEAA